MSDKEKEEHIQQDTENSERGSQLQSNKLKEAQGNKKNDESKDD